MFGALAVGAGALLGALGGSQGDRATRSVSLAPASRNETFGSDLAFNTAHDLEGLLTGNQFNEAATPLIGQLNTLIAQGGMPSDTQITQANQFAQALFAPQQEALNNSYTQAKQDVARTAAILGRPIDDPILNAKLAQFQGQQQAELSANQGAFAAQFAQQMPTQMLNLQQQLASIRAGLASQAIANRQALFNIGNTMQTQGQNFRLGTATQTVQSGGGFGGAINGAIAGIGAAGKLFSGFSKASGSNSSATQQKGFPTTGQTAFGAMMNPLFGSMV